MTKLVAQEHACRNAALDAVSSAPLRRGYRDDTMNLAFTVTPRAPGMPPSAEDSRWVGAMRRVLAARLRYCGLEDLIGDVTLAVSELVTNAILHSGGTSVGLTMTVGDGSVYVAVSDGMPGRGRVRTATDDEESGRGLLLLAALMREHGGAWGQSPVGDVTWCRFVVPTGGPR
ncbi:ATP-binding protein [Streptomyces sp. NPDC056160]|uniref:ATP-binding protein n=1 Tax=Streptomyces sp. NPDC056160 TaxID=3345731 RepID=UPI0035E371DA